MRPRFSLSALQRRIVIVVLGLVFSAIAGSAVIARRAEPPSFCRICGARETQISWAVRGTNVRLCQTRRVRGTPISELLTSKHLIGDHTHLWLAPRRVPNPLDEAGAPVLASLEFASAPRVVHFIRDLAQYGDARSIAQWQATVLQPQYSYVIDGALRFLLVPADGFSHRDDFLRWWSTNAFALQNRVRELTEPD